MYYVRGGGVRKYAEKVTLYYDPLPLIMTPFQNLCRLLSVRKGNNCTYYTKKARRRRKFL